MKKLFTILAFIFALLVVVSTTRASLSSLAYTFTYPTNASTIYPEIGVAHNMEITIDHMVNEPCKVMWGGNNTLYDMTNTSATNKTWNYTSWVVPDSALNDDWQNLRYKCGNTSAIGNWSNTSATANLHMFRIKEATYTIIDRVIVNNSILSAAPTLNITIVSDNATNCSYNYNNGGFSRILTNMTLSSSREYWSNPVALSWSDSAFGVWHNITYRCQDSCGNTSNSGIYFFKLDTVKPQFVGTPTFNLYNKTSGGNYLSLTFNISDKVPSACRIRLYFEEGTVVNISEEISYSTSLENSNCTINVTPSEITQDGFAWVVPAAQDGAGNENISETNQTWIFYRLKTGWNLVTGYENKTLGEIAGEFTNVTYVSVWDNLNKLFSTHTVGGSTNKNIAANYSSKYGAGAAYIYVAADLSSMRKHYDIGTTWLNTTLYVNSSADKTTWNIVGVPKQITDLNASLLKQACTDEVEEYTGNCANITWVSWYNIQEGEYCSFYRNRLATSCSGITSTGLNMTRGDALWIAVVANSTNNRNFVLNRNLW